jgi:cytochrome c oxidase assembly factor CtaG
VELDPGAIAWIVVAEGLYLRALRILAARGVEVGRWQVVCWHLGIALWTFALVGPLADGADGSLMAHMGEHLLLADIGAPLLLAGMRNPVLVFLLPRSVLVAAARRERLRRLFRTLRRPLVATPVFVIVLYGWHIGPAFEAAVKYPAVHALQHATFVATGMLVWWAALEPKKRRLRGELWKIGHILGARMLSMFLGMSFVLIKQPVYTGVYGSGERRYGLDAVADQQTAGAIMVSVDIALMAFALAFFFYRASEQDRADTAAG